MGDRAECTSKRESDYTQLPTSRGRFCLLIDIVSHLLLFSRFVVVEVWPILTGNGGLFARIAICELKEAGTSNCKAFGSTLYLCFHRPR
jgi:hypothetical protein